MNGLCFPFLYCALHCSTALSLSSTTAATCPPDAPQGPVLSHKKPTPAPLQPLLQGCTRLDVTQRLTQAHNINSDLHTHLAFTQPSNSSSLRTHAMIYTHANTPVPGCTASGSPRAYCGTSPPAGRTGAPCTAAQKPRPSGQPVAPQHLPGHPRPTQQAAGAVHLFSESSL